MTDQRFVIEKTDGTIKGGKAIRNAIDELYNGRWVVSIAKYKKKRSNSQNAYYHGCIIPAVMDGLVDMGFDKSELNKEVVHEMLKQKFLKKDIANEQGEFVTITQSTASLSTIDFMSYIDDIQKWGAVFLSINIPDPETQSEINFK